MAADKNVVLDLDTTLDNRQKVRIDGRLYPIRDAGELSILGTRRAWATFGQLSGLLNITKPSRKQEKALADLLDETCRMVLEAPDNVHKKLKQAQRLQVITVFSSLLPGMPPTGATPPVPATTNGRSIGARRSRG